MTTKDSKPTASEVLETLTHHIAQDEAENGKPSADDRRWSKNLGAQVEARLAELRRQLTPEDAPMEKSKPLRQSTLAMTRDALLEAIARISAAMGGTVQYAHRNLKGLTDDDLRRLYDTLDPNNRTPE